MHPDSHKKKSPEPRPFAYRQSCRFGSKRRGKAGGVALSALRWLPWLKTGTVCRSIAAAPSLFYFLSLSTLCLFSSCYYSLYSPFLAVFLGGGVQRHRAEGGCFERRCSGLEFAQNPVLLLIIILRGKSGFQDSAIHFISWCCRCVICS